VRPGSDGDRRPYAGALEKLVVSSRRDQSVLQEPCDAPHLDNAHGSLEFVHAVVEAGQEEVRLRSDWIEAMVTQHAHAGG
jgi:hypothetical protein